MRLRGSQNFRTWLSVCGWAIGFCRPLSPTQNNSSISQSNVPSGHTVDLTSLEHAGTQSSTVSLGLNCQYNLHSTGLPPEHAQSQLRLHGPPLNLQGVGLLLSVQRLRGIMTWKCSGESVKARQINIDDKLIILIVEEPSISWVRALRALGLVTVANVYDQSQ